jgi:hypothetical protein
MRIIGVVLIAAAVLLGTVPGAGAQAPTEQPSAEALQAAKDLVAVTSPDTIAELKSAIAANFWPEIEASVRKQYPKIDDQTLAELRVEYERVMSDAAAFALGEAPAIYARHFTVSELKELTAFYRTPAGAKALTVMPKAMAEVLPVLQAHVQSGMPKFAAAFTDILKKHGYQPK